LGLLVTFARSPRSLARSLARPPEIVRRLSSLFSFLFSSAAAALVVIVVAKFVIVFLGCGREFHYTGFLHIMRSSQHLVMLFSFVS
jgi:hypothetical protein